MLKKPLKKNVQDKSTASRRKFLTGAAAAAGAAMGAMPLIARAQAQKPAAPAVASSAGPISMRWQSTWPAKDIFHEYALDFAKKVNDMTGG
jgi:TRAP-type mannitol/chloroaromatic compound transport system substrate-binding protein